MTHDRKVVGVVVTHNRPDELRLVIEALRNQTYRLHHVLVIDNGSLPPAREMLAATESLTVIESPTNVGGAGGFSLGIAKSLEFDADWYWLMDDDAVPRLNALEVLMGAPEAAFEDTGALCSRVYETGRLAVEHQRFYSSTGREIPADHASEKPQRIDAASFVGLCLRRPTLLEAGLPLARFFISYDDTEYSLRLKRLGWRIWLVPESIIDHLKKPDNTLQSKDFGQRHYYDIRNRILVARLHATRPVFASVRASLVGVRLFQIAPKPRFFPALSTLMAALYDGLRMDLDRMK